MLTAVSERIEVTGIVQGVGFRPFVHRLATVLEISGHVGNDSTKVFIEASGSADAIEEFVCRLRSEAPRLAQIETINRTETKSNPTSGFAIVDSRQAPGHKTLVAPDTAVCPDCVEELFDENDRRFGHAFITCTNCGPRFTIIEDVPYDRPNTTMAGFVMCDACHHEYVDPSNRRYHAQPIGCHDCGPQLSMCGAVETREADPISQAAQLLRAGAIVAIKGLGGYHLCCDATNDKAVALLRSRKQRADKPFAVMVSSIDDVEDLAELSPAERDLLTSPAAPIVLLPSNTDSPVSTLVAPGNPLLGVMLPYTPIHHLLMRQLGKPVVMTSANRGGEPIAFTIEMVNNLEDLYDARVDHDRPIHVPCDDSVVRIVADQLMPIRRARGYAPIPVPMPRAQNSVLAAGAELKNTFCVATGTHAWVSQHIGDMENLSTVQAMASGVEQFSDMYDITPSVVAVDAHPGYLSSKWGRRNHSDKVLEVQHHHAHVAAVMAEHQIAPDQHVIGFAFDGTGYGPDGTIWGGEALVANAKGFHRAAYLRPIALPGGDSAIRNPNRIALAHLYAADIEWHTDLAPLRALTKPEQALLRTQLERSISCTPTTSMGRLFDAVASLIGLRQQISYEAQAAIELENAATQCSEQTRGYRFTLNGPEVDPTLVLTSIVEDLADAAPIETIAWRFHDAVAEIVTRLATVLSQQHGSSSVALTGGVFQNALLTTMCLERLNAASLHPLRHHLVPPNDGGLALGQAYIAAHHTQQPKET